MSTEHGRRRRSVLRLQKRLIIAGIVLVILLIPTLIIVNKIVGITTFTDYDGEKYKIKEEGGKYAMYDRSGNLLEQTTDGYYVTSKLSTLVEVDEETGEYEIIAVVDTEDGEYVGTSSRLLMFKHTSQENIQQIEVHNSYGSFTFYRDADDDFQIKGYEGMPYTQTLFSSLAVSAGYTLTMQKIDNPIKDEDGNYTEYGLAKQTRTDENGNSYEYTPNWYRLTDTDGNAYTVYVGDAIPSGAGYYVKLTTRDAVYIMNYSVEGSIISMYDTGATADDVENIMDLPLEGFVTPVVCYPMTLNTYFDVQNFSIYKGEEVAKAEADENYDLKPFICFSFWDMDDRFGTFYHTRSYNLVWPEGYLVNTSATDVALQAFYTMSFIGVTKVGVTEEDLKTYGLDTPAYIIYFNFQDIDHYISISEMTETGTYYMTSALYDMIVEVSYDQLLFLQYDLTDWVAPGYFDMNLAWAKEIIVECGDETYTFECDNSQSDSMSNPTYSETAASNTTISSDKMTMKCHDSKGNTMQAVSSISVTDKSGFTWTVTADKVTAVDSSGNSASIKGAKYATNALGTEVVVLVGVVEGTDGTKVAVDANYITVTDADGHVETYLRYGMSIFRKFYQSMLYASIEGNAHDGVYGLSDEKIAEYTADPDKDVQCKITVKTTYEKEPEYVYRYYAYSERRSLLTVNGGTGEFYVLRSFTDKMVTDAGRVLRGESVDPISKY